MGASLMSTDTSVPQFFTVLQVTQVGESRMLTDNFLLLSGSPRRRSSSLQHSATTPASLERPSSTTRWFRAP